MIDFSSKKDLIQNKYGKKTAPKKYKAKEFISYFDLRHFICDGNHYLIYVIYSKRAMC
jgi:hypothetical protein